MRTRSPTDKLFLHAYYNDVGGIEAAIAAGADVNHIRRENIGSGKREYFSPLDKAIARGHVDAIRALLAAGAARWRPVPEGPEFAEVREIIERQEEANEQLRQAFRKNDKAAVRCILESGVNGIKAQLNAPYGQQEVVHSAFFFSSSDSRAFWANESLFAEVIKGGDIEAIEMFAKAGGDIRSNKAITIAFQRKNRADILTLFISLGLDVDTRLYSDGKTFLHCAVHGQYRDLVRALLEAGADTTIKDAGGWKARKYAYGSVRDMIDESIESRSATKTDVEKGEAKEGAPEEEPTEVDLRQKVAATKIQQWWRKTHPEQGRAERMERLYAYAPMEERTGIPVRQVAQDNAVDREHYRPQRDPALDPGSVDQRLNEAKVKFFEAFQELEFDFVHASFVRGEDDRGKQTRTDEIEKKRALYSEAGYRREFDKNRQGNFPGKVKYCLGSDEFVFGWFIVRGDPIPLLFSQDAAYKTYHFDAVKMSEKLGVGLTVRDDRGSVYLFGGINHGQQFANVSVSTEVRKGASPGQGVKRVTVQNGSDEPAIYEVPEGGLYLQGPNIREKLALDVLRMLHWVEKEDPEAALAALRPFDPQHAVEFSDEARRAHAAQLFRKTGLREATVGAKLPFESPDGELLLRETKSWNKAEHLYFFYKAVESKDVGEADKALYRKLSARTTDDYRCLETRQEGTGLTPLMLYIKHHLDISYILQLKPNLEAAIDHYHAAGGMGETALIFAVRCGNADAVKKLVKAGANIQARCLQGNALLLAEKLGFDDIADYLYEQGARYPDGAARYVVPEEDRAVLKQINDLARIVSEGQSWEACDTYMSGQGNVVFVQNVANSSRGYKDRGAVHNREAANLAVALGSRKFFANPSNFPYNEVNTIHLSDDEYMGGGLGHFVVTLDGQAKQVGGMDDHAAFSSLEDVRDRLLQREFETLLVSADNCDHFLATGERMPHVDHGANDRLATTKEDRLDGYLVHVGRTDTGDVELTFRNTDETDTTNRAEKAANQVRLILGVPEEVMAVEENRIVITKPDDVEATSSQEFLIEQMQNTRTNYVAILVYDQHGRVALANRKSHNKVYGMAGAGGHNNDPYVPWLGAAVELAEEFGLKVKDGLPKNSFERIGQKGDLDIYAVPWESLQHVDATVFEDYRRTCGPKDPSQNQDIERIAEFLEVIQRDYPDHYKEVKRYLKDTLAINSEMLAKEIASAICNYTSYKNERDPGAAFAAVLDHFSPGIASLYYQNLSYDYVSFKSEAHEFERASERMFSFEDMTDRSFGGLRNIDSLEYLIDVWSDSVKSAVIKSWPEVANAVLVTAEKRYRLDRPQEGRGPKQRYVDENFGQVTIAGLTGEQANDITEHMQRDESRLLGTYIAEPKFDRSASGELDQAESWSITFDNDISALSIIRFFEEVKRDKGQEKPSQQPSTNVGDVCARHFQQMVGGHVNSTVIKACERQSRGV